MVDASPALRILSVVIGWTYFTAWSISFYPQVLLNFRRKDVDGYSIDFAVLNALGHSSYALYSLNFFFNPSVREDYRRRHDGHENSVQANDVAFATHAATLAIITYIQTLWYPRGSTQRLSSWNRGVVTLLSLALIIHTFALISGKEHTIDLLYFLSYFKLYVSFAKYVPQAWLNYKRKSTVGWSIGNILLDLTGGVLSLVQLFLDAHIENDWTSITGNPVKFGLSFLSIIFDLVFVVQHFVLYTDHRDEKLRSRVETKSQDVESTAAQSGDERTPLLG